MHRKGNQKFLQNLHQRLGITLSAREHHAKAWRGGAAAKQIPEGLTTDYMRRFRRNQDGRNEQKTAKITKIAKECFQTKTLSNFHNAQFA
jgi:hypothetical protein